MGELVIQLQDFAPVLVVIQVSSVTSLVFRVTGEGTAPSHAPVFMVHIVTLEMESAAAELLTAVSVTLVGLALTVPRPVVMTLGDQTVTMLVCVSTVECVIRLLAIAFVHLGSWVLTVNMLVHQTALVKIVFTHAVVPPRHLSAVTHSVAPVSVNQVLLDHAAQSLALLAHGV